MPLGPLQGQAAADALLLGRQEAVFADLRHEDVIYAGNRFMIYALFPECRVSAHLIWGKQRQNTVIAMGKSILDRTSPVDIGALMLHYGGLDERVNAGIPAYEAALKAAGTTYELYVYEGANHAFNNDTSPARYNAEAAKLAWDRTLRLFKQQLG